MTNLLLIFYYGHLLIHVSEMVLFMKNNLLIVIAQV